MQLISNLGAAIFALLASGFWFYSAAKPLPPMITYWDQAPANDPFYSAMRASVKFNRWAALFSGLAAFCAFMSAVLSHSPPPNA